MSITMQDIADCTGFNPGTVSRALNGDTRVRESTRRTIEKTADKLGYVMNRNARNLVSGRTKLVCLAVPSLAYEWISEQADVINRVLSGHGYTLMILVHNDSWEQFRNCLRDFSQKLCDAAILLSPAQNLQDVPELELLRKAHFPMLFLDQWFPGKNYPVVTNDAERSIAVLTEELLADGMEAALIAFPPDNTVACARRDAACRILTKAGIPFAVIPEEDPAAFLRQHKVKTLAIYGDSPVVVQDLSALNLPYRPGRCIGGMFDRWRFNAPSFYDKIFLCIQDAEAEGTFAAESILRALRGEALSPDIWKFPPVRMETYER